MRPRPHAGLSLSQWFVALASSLASVMTGRSDPPALTAIAPSAIAPGRTTEITLRGEDLGGATKLWTSCRAEVVKVNGSNLAFRVTPAAGTPIGIGALQVITTNGASHPALFMVDDLPTLPAGAGNHSLSNARTVTIPAAVDGACNELESDFYKFTARKGRRVAVEVVAQQLGSLLDPHVRLLDAKGRELLAVEDTPGYGADCAFSYRIPKSGDYVLELRDTKYEGGTSHRYRLRIGDFTIGCLPFLNGAIDRALSEAGSPDGKIVIEREPNDLPGRALLPALPVTILGGFNKSRDRDIFEFEAGKDDRIVARGRTRSLGSPCDLFFQIQDTNGNKLAEANVTGADEGSVTNTFTKAGRYRLVVEELNQCGGPNLNYRLEIRALTPGFSLTAEAADVSAPPGGSFEIAVKPLRNGYEGPISLHLVGVEPKFTVTNSVITAKTNAVKLKVIVPSNLQPGDFRQFVVLGRATIEDRTAENRASTLPALRKLFPGLLFPPEAMDGLIGLGISAQTK